MNDFIFEIQEPLNYQKRLKDSLKFNFWVCCAIFILATLISNWQYGLFLVIIIGIVQYYKSSNWEKYFITYIENKSGTVTIRNKKRNDIMELVGNLKDFKIKKKFAFDRGRIAFLAIYYRERLLLKQFEIGDWNETKFDQVLIDVS